MKKPNPAPKNHDNFIKAQTLSQALPFIQKFHNKLIIIKLGGATLEVDNDKRLHLFVQDLVLLKTIGIHPILVHGGGAKVSHLLERLGKNSEFLDGLRVTDPETMDITQMVLAGLINKNLVSLISSKGGKAVGVSGKDGSIARGKKLKKKGHDYGQVGEIIEINPELILNLTESGYIPVIAPIAIESNESSKLTKTNKTTLETTMIFDSISSLNINADTFAAEIALSLQSEKLVFISNVPGLLKNPNQPESLISSLKLKEIPSLIKKKIVTQGMIPKLQAAEKALTHGVNKVHFISEGVNHSLLVELFTEEGIGTIISKN